MSGLLEAAVIKALWFLIEAINPRVTTVTCIHWDDHAGARGCPTSSAHGLVESLSVNIGEHISRAPAAGRASPCRGLLTT